MKIHKVIAVLTTMMIFQSCGYLTPPPATTANLILKVTAVDSDEPIQGAAVSLLTTNSTEEAMNSLMGGELRQSSITSSSGCALFDMDVLFRPHDFSCLQYQFDSLGVVEIASEDVRDRFIMEAPNPKVCNAYSFSAQRPSFSVVATHDFVIGTYALCADPE